MKAFLCLLLVATGVSSTTESSSTRDSTDSFSTETVNFSTETVTTGTTEPPTSTTLPNVNVSYVQFSPEICSNGFCSYSYVAPYNNPVVLMTEENIIAEDQAHYDIAVNNVSSFNNKVASSVTDAQNKINALQAQLDEAQELLNQMQTQLNLTIQNTNQALSYLNFANFYIKSIDRTTCAYSCTLPPTSPPTPPSTTPPPTTPAPACDTFNCTGVNSANDTCIYKPEGSNQPFCNYCTGNFDGFQQCQYSTCGNNLTATVGSFWSPGMNDTTGNATVGLGGFNGRTCTWNYPNTTSGYAFNTTSGAFNLNALGTTDADPKVTLIPLNGDPDNVYSINYQTSMKKLNTFLRNNNISSFQLQLTVPSSYTVKSYFYWDITLYTSSTTSSSTIE